MEKEPKVKAVTRTNNGNMDLNQLVTELERQNLLKRDIVVGGKQISMRAGELIINNFEGNSAIDEVLKGTGAYINNEASITMLEGAHNNLSEKLVIPRSYYNRMNETALPLLDHNVSYWFQNSAPKNYFVRTFTPGYNCPDDVKGFVRSILSDSFRTIDNLDVLVTALEAIQKTGANVKIQHCALTEKRMYVRFIAPDVATESKKLLEKYISPETRDRNNGLCTGFVISNSETGNGQFQISPLVHIYACSNGLIVADEAFKRYHLGEKMEKNSTIIWSQKTEQKNAELIESQITDAVKTFVSPDFLGKIVTRLEGYSEKEIVNPVEAINNICKVVGINAESRVNSVLKYFTTGGDISHFGVSQALTYYAHKDANADERFDIETQALTLLPRMGEFDKKEKVKA